VQTSVNGGNSISFRSTRTACFAGTNAAAAFLRVDSSRNKLEKFFIERGAIGYEPHVKFLRVLQDT
jgi:hypothetical protein